MKDESFCFYRDVGQGYLDVEKKANSPKVENLEEYLSCTAFSNQLRYLL